MEMCIPLVKDVSLYKEIAKNIVNPLEVPREAISNSIDAEAKNINIELYRNNEGLFCIDFIDDGVGMGRSEIESFFNLGDSQKDIRSIGEKGLGTKIFFKSKRIVVKAQKENAERTIAIMDNPWDNLNSNKVPSYTIENESPIIGNNGTAIRIEGYLIDNPERYFNFHTLKDYILWFTAGGSFKSLFAIYPELNRYVRNMQIAPRIFINDKIQQIKEEIAGTHQFYPPQENPKEDIDEKVYKKSVNYCRHFGPYHRSTNINGEYVSFQMYGTVSGVNCRKSICKLRHSERLKSRFGVYLAKDFIPVTKKSNLITNPNYHHFHLIVNSQNFELTADRNNISNQDDPKVKWILSNAKKIIDEDILPIADSVYFRMRKEEECQAQIQEKNIALRNRINNFDKLQELDIENIPIKKIPDNESQVALLLAALLSNDRFKQYINYIESIAHYSQYSTTDLICIDNEGKPILVEMEFLLSNIFRHDHPYETFDYIVCWKIDIEVNEKRKLVDGAELKLICENENWFLKCGADKVIPIIELSYIVKTVRGVRSINDVG
ncbi:ATP-binding protein [Clostridium sp. YIM B02505]|uniref:ATP-binding protein n=2 Tax=Clostridium yunnanense TaxID=2800325 RepID=A0ABS1EQN9_9CLOT|nr:ATP-binding protein [Clostridium yunnanense]